MVLIAARMVEKIHLEGKQVEQKGTPFFVWLLKAYGGWGGRGFSRPTAGKRLTEDKPLTHLIIPINVPIICILAHQLLNRITRVRPLPYVG